MNLFFKEITMYGCSLILGAVLLFGCNITPSVTENHFEEFEKIEEEMNGFRSHMGKISKNRDELRDAQERYLNAQTQQEKLDSMADQSKAFLKIIKGKDDALKALRRGIASINAANATDSSDGSQLDNFLGGRITDIKVSYKVFRAESDEIKRAAKFSEDGKLTKAQESLVTILDHQAAKLEEFVKNCEKNMKYGDLDAEGVAKIRMTVLDKWRLTLTAAERNLAATLTHNEVQLKVLMMSYESLNRQKTFDELVRAASPGALSEIEARNRNDLYTYRIVLSWDKHPRDLDSHLWFRNNHVYPIKKQGTLPDMKAVLDVDDTTSYGPETITIHETFPDTRYYYSVHDFTNKRKSQSNKLSAISEAKVYVYKGETDETLMKFSVPSNGKKGNLWKVFYINTDGRIVEINSIVYTDDNDGGGIMP